MTRSHLVPTPVTDKNGVQTTRLKRPEAFGTRAASVPSPMAPKAPDVARERLLERLEAATRFDAINVVETERNAIMDEASGMGSASIENIAQLFEQYPPCYNLLNSVMTYARKLHQPEMDEFTGLMRDHFYPLSEIDGHFAPESGFSHSQTALGIILGARQIFRNRNFTEDQKADLIYSTAAILRATKDTDDPDNLITEKKAFGVFMQNSYQLSSPHLIDYVLSNPGSPKAINQLMTENPHFQEAELLYLLENPDTSRALLDGAL